MSPNELSAEDHDSLDLPASMFRTGETVKEFTLAMWRPSTEKVRNLPAHHYSVVDGLALFEGDIELGTAEELEEVTSKGRGAGITGAKFRWPKGVVPFVAQAAVKVRAEAAIAHWQKLTPFRFPKRTNQPNYISFEVGSGCSSMVGRRGGKQVIRLASNCSTGSTIHEIGHAVGLWHEQSREDRNKFVKILKENIKPEAISNFEQHILDGDDLGAYDYGSIMHYPRGAFTRNGNDTIVPTKPNVVIGQRKGLSKGDIVALKKMYPNLPWPAGDEAESPADEVTTPA